MREWECEWLVDGILAGFVVGSCVVVGRVCACEVRLMAEKKHRQRGIYIVSEHRSSLVVCTCCMFAVCVGVC